MSNQLELFDKGYPKGKYTPNKWLPAISRWNWSEDSQKFFVSLCKGFTLNLCSGSSFFGDIKVDINKRFVDLQADVCGKSKYLPFRDLSFDTIFIDPPYRAEDYSIDMPKIKYGVLKKELHRILKHGGRIVFCQFYPVEFVGYGYRTVQIFINKRLVRAGKRIIEIHRMPVIVTISEKPNSNLLFYN